MSEFKFACPVCGQHITADSSTGGTQLECPTCFQKIIVPQAPASSDSKYILSAAQVAKPRETANGSTPDLGPLQRSPRRTVPIGVGLLFLLCAAGATVFVYRERIFHSSADQDHNGATNQSGKVTARKAYDVPA